MRHFLRIFSLILCLCSFCPANAAPDSKIYNIGVFNEPPFGMYRGDGFTGVSVDIWEHVAQIENIHYKLVRVPDNTGEALKLVHDHKIDGLIGPLSVTSDRVKLVDFSRPFFINKLGSLSSNDENDFWDVVANILYSEFGLSLLAIISVLFIFSFTYWYIEEYKKHTADPNRRASYLQILYISALSFLSSAPLEGEFKSKAMKVFNVVLVLTSLVLVSSFVGVITSALTISSSNLEMIGDSNLSTLYGKTVAVRKGSYANHLALLLGAKVVETQNMKEAITALKEGQVDSIIGNYLTLKDYSKNHPQLHFSTDSLILGANEFAFAFPQGSPLLDRVDYALVLLQEKNDIVGICAKFLSKQDSIECII